MTTSYTTGTVSVTAGSDIVTGLGTAWLTANIAPGYFGLDSANGNPVPVAEIVSDTSMRLVKPWRGTTAAGQAYWLSYDTRDGQQTVNNAQRLAEYIARLDNASLSALAALVPEADTIPYFPSNGSAALASFNSAARALLAGGVVGETQLPSRLREGSVDSSSNFNSALNNGFYLGGTATTNAPIQGVRFLLLVQKYNENYIVQVARQVSTTARSWTRTMFNGAWTSWFLVGIPVLGTVSQASGVPTGAIIERGSNANGEYVRFADGTQICTSVDFSSDVTLTSGSVFRSSSDANGSILWTFPVSFSALPYVVPGRQNNASTHWVSARSISATQGSANVWSFVSTTGRNVALMAIGRWF